MKDKKLIRIREALRIVSEVKNARMPLKVKPTRAEVLIIRQVKDGMLRLGTRRKSNKIGTLLLTIRHGLRNRHLHHPLVLQLIIHLPQLDLQIPVPPLERMQIQPQ